MNDAAAPLVLVVEDEPKLARVLADYLLNAGFTTRIVGDGPSAVFEARASNPALVLLDVMLPGMDGMTVCREVRAFSDVPIIMVTARIDEIDRLLGLELGADDYICKPFSPREVVARVRAVLRRASGPGTATRERLEIDDARMQITLDGHRLDLTAVEFRLLRTLANAQGHLFARQAARQPVRRRARRARPHGRQPREERAPQACRHRAGRRVDPVDLRRRLQARDLAEVDRARP